MCTLRVSVPPGDFLLGCGSSGSRIKPAPPVGIAGFVSLLCHQPVGICCHCHPPGAVSWQPFPAPHRSSVPVGSVCWECASFLGISFCSRQSFWAVSFRVWLQKSLKGRITMRFVKVLLSDPTWQPVLCVGGCCVFALQGINVPFPIQPSRSQRLLQEYSSSASLCDN